ncbi:MAG: hypothetical protein ACK6DS_09865 [Planctomycetota bacterium]|jgi:hypothetical protein
MTTKSMASEFEASVENDFRFLKADYGFECSGVRSVDEDPRDSYLLARFARDHERIDVAWNEVAMSLSILVRLNNDELGRRERYVYFEPFIEFLSKGKVLPIAPQLFPKMTMRSIEAVMRQRSDAFKEGISSRMASLAEKLREYLATIRTSSTETIRAYHSWYETRTS